MIDLKTTAKTAFKIRHFIKDHINDPSKCQN